MELLQLRYFMTVARMLNISRAAAYHRIPQPAMSQTISRLEKELGADLFDRHKNKLTLTAKGQEFFEAVAAGLTQLDSAVQQLEEEDLSLRGELVLLVLQHRVTMVDCIAAFRKLYPQVSFRVFYDWQGREAEEYDLCIASMPPDENYGQPQPLIRDRLALLVSAGHPLAKEKQVDFSRLQKESFAVLDKKNSLWRHTEHLCSQSGYTPQISMTCEDLHCIIKYVATGMAVTVGPVIGWKDLKNDDVVFVPIVPQTDRYTYAFSRKHQRNARLCQEFLEFMTRFFADIQK